MVNARLLLFKLENNPDFKLTITACILPYLTHPAHPVVRINIKQW